MREGEPTKTMAILGAIAAKLAMEGRFESRSFGCRQDGMDL